MEAAQPMPEKPDQDLEGMPLDADIGSKEQLSVDQLTRSRLEFALSQNAAIIHQTQFADAKAATLLALTGLLALSIIEGRLADAPVAILGAHFALALLIVGICIFVLLPRMAPARDVAQMHRSDRFSWPVLTVDDYSAEQHASFLRTSQASQLVVSVARSNVAVSQILARKYLLLRVALILAIVDLLAVFGAALLVLGDPS